MIRFTTSLILALTLFHSTESFGQRASNERQAWYLAPCPDSDSEQMVGTIEKSILDGSFQAPAEGTGIQCGEEQIVPWKYLDIGSSRHSFEDVESGGWLYFSLENLPSGPALIDISGHERFYVNGELRPGRPEVPGMMKFPVELREGMNQIFVQAKGGPVTLKVQPLGETDEKVRFLQYDRVLPWLDDLKHVDVQASLLLVNAGDAIHDLRVGTKTRFEPLNKWADYPDDAVPGVWEFERIESIPAWSIVKLPLRVIGPPPHKRTGFPYPVDVKLERVSDGEVLATGLFNLSTRQPGNHELRTWRDKLGTVQSCMVLPPAKESASSLPPAIVAVPTVLRSMHQTAYAFEEGPSELIIVPGTRRLGMGSTAVGRSQIDDAIKHVRTLHSMDDEKIAIVGYADAGIAAWEMAQKRPGLFSGVVPIGTEVPLCRDTTMVRNIDGLDVILRHGELDGTVDAEMASRLGDSRRESSGRTKVDIKPGMKRWWGAATISDDSIYDYLFHGADETGTVDDKIDLLHDHTTMAHEDHWAVVHQRKGYSRPAEMSAVRSRNQLDIKTDNVRQLIIRGQQLGGTNPIEITIDGKDLSLDRSDDDIYLHNDQAGWRLAETVDYSGKNRIRSHYEHLFNRPIVLVYGTNCDEKLMRANWAKARYDAEDFWRVADGHAHVVADKELTAEHLHDANVILYGNADTNSVWGKMLPNCPIDVRSGSVRIGDRSWKGDDLMTRFIRPLPGVDSGLVAVVGISGVDAARLVQPVSVIKDCGQMPDWTLMNAGSIDGADAMASGEFDRDWNLAN